MQLSCGSWPCVAGCFDKQLTFKKWPEGFTTNQNRAMHASLAVHVHNPLHFSGRPKCGWMVPKVYLHANTFDLLFSRMQWVSGMETHPKLESFVEQAKWAKERLTFKWHGVSIYRHIHNLYMLHQVHKSYICLCSGNLIIFIVLHQGENEKYDINS